jgi:methylenetetrahydrofolate reductase (NADPH)
MRLKEIYSQRKTQKNMFFEEKLPVISFEVFPPKDDPDNAKTQGLYREFDLLKKFNPSLVSVTYGAGGSNREKSFDIVKTLCEKDFTVMPHFTCVCSSKNEIEKQLQEINSLNIENILALRGDEPQDINVCHLDFKYANELVKYIKSNTDLSIAVAGYPEGHIDAPDLFTDIDNLKRKIDEGAEAIFTQMFFDNEKFYNYIHLVRDAGIDLPVVAGILPIISYQQIERMLTLAKVTMPVSLKNQLEKYKDNNADIKKLGIEFATYQCSQLFDTEVAGLHFYTLNKAHSVSEILENLSVC